MVRENGGLVNVGSGRGSTFPMASERRLSSLSHSLMCSAVTCVSEGKPPLSRKEANWRTESA